MRLSFAFASSLLAVVAVAQNPYAPPRAFLHYAPDRTCDLQNVKVNLTIDYPNKTFTGHVENTMSPLRDGITQVKLNAGPGLQIDKVAVDGSSTSFKHDGRDLLIDVPALHKDKKIVIAIDYKSANARGGGMFGGGGFHWISARQNQPNHVGFWTQGESEQNSDWVPIWDYPNDLTTSETHCTVPADWTVIGNGVPIENRLGDDGKTRTFGWKMTLPHATYLLSLCGGPFDVTRDTWRGVPLLYVVPKGEGSYSPYTFSGTKDMLSFYSDTLGVKFAWPKYAQDAMFDFGGGMENVSATTMAENVLTEPRAGFRTGDSLISHEMAHQWFGDFVTCKDWGDIWLNESFATFMQMAYFEHSRGKDAYDQEVDNNTREYLQGSRRYHRALSTKMYQNADQMFESAHTYAKGGVILHTLRRQLGDGPFFAGLNLYLKTHAHTPVQASELCRSITEATGINCEPFFDQWILKPGHPVLDYTWTWNDATKELALTVAQTQDTADGTPIYKIPAKVGFISGSALVRQPIELTTTSQVFRWTLTAKPDAVLLDPDHDFLKEIPKLHWDRSELGPIIRYAPESADRMEAIRRLFADSPSDADVQLVVDAYRADKAVFPAFTTLFPLSNLERASLRGFFEETLATSASFRRRSDAVGALVRLPKDPGTIAKMREQVNDQAPIGVVMAVLRALNEWDAKGNADMFQKALTIPSRNDQIKRLAQLELDGMPKP